MASVENLQRIHARLVRVEIVLEQMLGRVRDLADLVQLEIGKEPTPVRVPPGLDGGHFDI